MPRPTSKASPASTERQRRRLERDVDSFALHEAVWPESGRLVVGVSGGPDSSALLLILAALRQKRSLRLVAAYFDHGLRGPEAAMREGAAAEALARLAGAEFVAGAGDVRGLAKAAKLSLEEAARRARYDFLAKVAEERQISTVAVGHTADDQAETVLMHIIRGSGLTGIGGMRPRSRWPSSGHAGLRLVRPLLKLSRAETESYCRMAGVVPITDESNASAAFLRNRVRTELFPALKRYNPRIGEALMRLADAARADISVLEEMAAEAVVEAEGAVGLHRARLRRMPEALRRHAARLALLRLLDDLQGFGETHIEAVVKVALADASGGRLDLPRGVRAEVRREIVALRTAAAKALEPLPATGAPLAVPGEVTIGGLRAMAGAHRIGGAKAWAEADAEALGGELCVRAWRPGDRMQPSGMKGTKKLQDLFVDAHVARAERGAIPVFESARGIVWVGGLRLAEWARPVEGRATVVLSFSREV